MALGRVDSYQAITSIAERSGIPFRVVSSIRGPEMLASGNLSYHSYGMAVDFGGYNQDALAQYFWQYRGTPGMKEIFHESNTRIYNWTSSRGEKPNEHPVYGAPDGHKGHLHVAMDIDAANAILGGAVPADTSSGGSSNPLSGIFDILSAGANFFKMLADPFTWKRAGWLLLGVLVLSVAFFAFGPSPKDIINKIPVAKDMI